MTTMTASEVKKRFGEIGEQVRSGPIHVTKSGRATMVILSSDEYDRLTEIEDRVWGERALDVVKNQAPIGVEATSKWLETAIGRER